MFPTCLYMHGRFVMLLSQMYFIICQILHHPTGIRVYHPIRHWHSKICGRRPGQTQPNNRRNYTGAIYEPICQQRIVCIWRIRLYLSKPKHVLRCFPVPVFVPVAVVAVAVPVCENLRFGNPYGWNGAIPRRNPVYIVSAPLFSLL